MEFKIYLESLCRRDATTDFKIFSRSRILRRKDACGQTEARLVFSYKIFSNGLPDHKGLCAFPRRIHGPFRVIGKPRNMAP